MVRERDVMCKGIGSFTDSTGSETTRHLPVVDAVAVRLQEDKNGVVSVVCPYYENQNCNFAWSLQPPFPEGLIHTTNTCKYSPAAWAPSEYKSELWERSHTMYEPAFTPESYFMEIWKSLTPNGRNAAKFVGSLGAEKRFVSNGMYVYQFSDNGDAFVEELAEHGVVEDYSEIERLQRALSQLKDGSSEDPEIRNNPHVLRHVTQRLEGDLREIEEQKKRYESDPRYATDPDFKATWDNWWEIKSKARTHIAFTPGFYTFLTQIL